MTSPASGGTFSIFSATNDAELDGLLMGTRWGGVSPASPLTITFSFPSSTSTWSTNPVTGYGASSSGEEPWNDFRALTASQQADTRSIFAMIERYANIDFVEVTETADSVGDIRIGFSGYVSSDASAHAYTPDGDLTSAWEGTAYPYTGDVWVNADDYSIFDSTPGSFDYHTLIHEIGHALGFKHPFEYEGSFDALPAALDSYDYTVMSYSPLLGNEDVWMSVYPTTFMPIDVAALQYMYGANADYNSGDNTYSYTADGNYNEVIWDGGGTDTLSYTSSSSAVAIDLEPGTWQEFGDPIEYYADFNGSAYQTRTGTVLILEDVTIENAIGGEGSDEITGNSADNSLAGAGGDDMLDGGSGDDTLDGGSGDDTLDGGSGLNLLKGGDGSDSYYIRSSADSIEDNGTGASDFDIAYSFVSTYTLDDTVEDGAVMSSGTAQLTGNDTDNILYAGRYGSTLDGGGGTDTADFSLARKTVKINLASSAAQKTSGSGSVTLTAIENLAGGKYNDKLTGNSDANVISGGSGRDQLTGGGGADIFAFTSASDSSTSSSAMDTIKDFVRGTDMIDLSAIDADTATTADDAFTSLIDSSDSFTAAGQLKLSGGVLYGNTDSDDTAEFAIKISGANTLALTDLIV